MLDDKALDLGRQIGQSPEYQALRRAEGALRADPDAVTRLEKIQELARLVDSAISRGELHRLEDTLPFGDLRRDLEMSVAGQAYVVARANFDKLMARVNHQISQGIEKGAASSIITL